MRSRSSSPRKTKSSFLRELSVAAHVVSYETIDAAAAAPAAAIAAAAASPRTPSGVARASSSSFSVDASTPRTLQRSMSAGIGMLFAGPSTTRQHTQFTVVVTCRAKRKRVASSVSDTALAAAVARGGSDPGVVTWQLRKRYSDFQALHDGIDDLLLLEKYAKFRDQLPELPEKRWMGRFDPTFLEERRKGLESYLQHLLRQKDLRRTWELLDFLDVSNTERINSDVVEELHTARIGAEERAAATRALTSAAVRATTSPLSAGRRAAAAEAVAGGRSSSSFSSSAGSSNKVAVVDPATQPQLHAAGTFAGTFTVASSPFRLKPRAPPPRVVKVTVAGEEVMIAVNEAESARLLGETIRLASYAAAVAPLKAGRVSGPCTIAVLLESRSSSTAACASGGGGGDRADASLCACRGVATLELLELSRQSRDGTKIDQRVLVKMRGVDAFGLEGGEVLEWWWLRYELRCPIAGALTTKDAAAKARRRTIWTLPTIIAMPIIFLIVLLLHGTFDYIAVATALLAPAVSTMLRMREKSAAKRVHRKLQRAAYVKIIGLERSDFDGQSSPPRVGSQAQLSELVVQAGTRDAAAAAASGGGGSSESAGPSGVGTWTEVNVRMGGFADGLPATAPVPASHQKLLGELDTALALATSAARHEDGGWEDEGERDGVHAYFKWVDGTIAATTQLSSSATTSKRTSQLYGGAKGVVVINAPAWAVFSMLHDMKLRAQWDARFDCAVVIDTIPLPVVDPAVINNAFTTMRVKYLPVWPLLPRDAVVVAVAKILADGSLISSARSFNDPSVALDTRKYVRADVQYDGYMVEPLGDQANRCRLTHCDVMAIGAGVPAYIVRKAAHQRSMCLAKFRTLVESTERERWASSPKIAYPALLPPSLRHLLPADVLAASENESESGVGGAAQRGEEGGDFDLTGVPLRTRAGSSEANEEEKDAERLLVTPRAWRREQRTLSGLGSLGLPLDGDDDFRGARNSDELRAEFVSAALSPPISPAAATAAAPVAERPLRWEMLGPGDASPFRHIEASATANVENDSTGITECWCAGSSDAFDVRGKRYLDDSAKCVQCRALFSFFGRCLRAHHTIPLLSLPPPTHFFSVCRFPSKPAMFVPVGANLVRSTEEEGPLEVATASLPSLQRYMRLHTERDSGDGDQTMFLIVNFVLPGPPQLSFVILFKKTVASGKDAPFDNLFNQFIAMDDEFRNGRFKFACRLISAPWLLKTAVTSLGGVKPTIIGKKLKTEYLHSHGNNNSVNSSDDGSAPPVFEPRFLEITIYVNSSAPARSIFGLIGGGAPKIAMEFAFFLEGQDESELPERLMGCFRLCHASIDAMTVDRK